MRCGAGHFNGVILRPLCAPMDVPESDPELVELVECFGHRVRFFARRVERRFGLGAEWRDDLISAGYWGLLKALRNRRDDATLTNCRPMFHAVSKVR